MVRLDKYEGATGSAVSVDADSLTLDECSDLARMLEKKYVQVLGQRKISVTVHATSDEAEVVVLLSTPDETFYYPIETRMKHKTQEQTVRQAQLFLADYVDLYLEEYLFEDDQLFIPIDWTDYHYDAIDFQMRGQVINRKLEKLAAEWIKNKTQ